MDRRGGPGDAPLTIDVDSTICEVYGTAKQGARYGYTKARGYHPLVRGRGRQRRRVGCAPARRQRAYRPGAASFLTEVFNRARAAGAVGPLTLRGDSGFYSKNVIDACKKADVRYSITVKVVYYWIERHHIDARRGTSGRLYIPFGPDVEAASRARIADSVHLPYSQKASRNA